MGVDSRACAASGLSNQEMETDCSMQGTLKTTIVSPNLSLIFLASGFDGQLFSKNSKWNIPEIIHELYSKPFLRFHGTGNIPNSPADPHGTPPHLSACLVYQISCCSITVLCPGDIKIFKTQTVLEHTFLLFVISFLLCIIHKLNIITGMKA